MSLNNTPWNLYHNNNAVEGISVFCYRAGMTTSAGLWLGDNPLNFSFPLLLYQITLIFIFTRVVHVLLRRLDQPLVISQIIAGMLLGPSFLGRSKEFEDLFFAPACWEQLNIVAFLAFMLFLFTIGVKTDLRMIPKSGNKAVAIALLGTSLPFIFVLGIGYALGSHIPARLWEHLLLLNFASEWSMTSYIVLSCALKELNLLTSKIGRLAMSACLIADFVRIFLSISFTVYLLNYKLDSLDKALASLGAFFGFTAFLIFVARPLSLWLIRKTPEGGFLNEACLLTILLLAIGCGLLSEIIGYHFSLGPFALGLLLPGGAPLGVTMVERLDRLVTGIFLPVYLALAGLRMDLASLRDMKQWGFFEMFIILCVLGKFFGAVLPCVYCRMPLRDAISLGLIMNFKGISEVKFAMLWQDKKVVDDQLYTILILSIVVLGGSTAPLVKHIYHPEDRFVANKRRTIQHSRHNDELRVLACVHSQSDVESILTLLDASRPSRDYPICIYLLHLIQLAGRADATLAPHKRRPKKTWSSASASDRIVNAFRFFEQQHLGAISVLPFICISPYATMHDDICSLALDKKAVLIIIPFHKQVATDGTVESTNPAIQHVNVNVLSYAPCSVGILIDRGIFGGPLMCPAPAGAASSLSHNIVVYFLGGADDREALAYAIRMAEDRSVGLSLVRFRQSNNSRKQFHQSNNTTSEEEEEEEEEEELDDEMVEEFVTRSVDRQRMLYREEVVQDGEEMVGVIRETHELFSLLMVGRSEGIESPLTVGLSMWSEYPELGTIGDLLASTDFGCRVSTLVVQQQTRVKAGMMQRNSRQLIPLPN